MEISQKKSSDMVYSPVNNQHFRHFRNSLHIFVLKTEVRTREKKEEKINSQFQFVHSGGIGGPG